MKKHTVLIVDDEVGNVDALERLFRKTYKVLKSTSPIEALEIAKDNKISVIISDQRMPEMTGVEFFANTLSYLPNAVRILLTGYTDIESVIGAINDGHIYRYVTKPWDPIDLSNAVDKAVERYEMGEELVQKNLALQTALDELKTLDQAKNQFMVLINHELKTPLTSLLSFSDLLNESSLDSEQKRMLNRIQQSAHRLQELINDTLEFVSAETALHPVNNLNHVTSSLFSPTLLTEKVLQTAARRGVHFQFDIENQTLHCDEKIIRNVVLRLTHNAAKFADENSLVWLRGHVLTSPPESATLKDATAPTYLFSVENTGPALDPKRISQILKPFALDENILHHSVGTGLGLSICQALLKLQGTTLCFSSNISHLDSSSTDSRPRTTASFTLPLGTDTLLGLGAS